jgi:hypothetical protein
MHYFCTGNELVPGFPECFSLPAFSNALPKGTAANGCLRARITPGKPGSYGINNRGGCGMADINPSARIFGIFIPLNYNTR